MKWIAVLLLATAAPAPGPHPTRALPCTEARAPVRLELELAGVCFLPRAVAVAEPSGTTDGLFNPGGYNITGPASQYATARGTSIHVTHFGPGPVFVSSRAGTRFNLLIMYGPSTGSMRLVPAAMNVRFYAPGNAVGTYVF
jgi:hypothetical protein